jgi:citrate lyase subunit beta/citryl-CoA lyase
MDMANPMRSLLWVPGNIQEKIAEALACDADCIVLDLEDTVPLAEKDKARQMVVATLSNTRPPDKLIGVRINSWQSPFGMDDLRAVVAARPDLIRLPKCNTREEMLQVDELIGRIEAAGNLTPGSVPVIVSIESALGLINAYPIATAAKRVIGLGIGVEDYTTDMKTVRSTRGLEVELLYARSHLVTAARAAGIKAIDGAFLDLSDEEGLIAETQLIKQLGFDGKGLTHPKQIAVVHKVFAPSEKEVIFARKVVQAFKQAEQDGSFYVFVDGKLVDPPVYAKAQRILELSGD